MLYYEKLAYIEPVLIFNYVATLPGIIFLDSSNNEQSYGRYSFIMFEPLASYLGTEKSKLIKDTVNLVFHHNINDAITAWQELFQSQSSEHNPNFPPFTGGLAGYFSYDLSKHIEVIPTYTKTELPEYVLGLYNKVFAFDHYHKECFIFVNEVNGFNVQVNDELKRLLTIYNQVKQSSTVPDLVPIDLAPTTIITNFNKDEYIALIKQAEEYILKGDVYEINLAQQFSGKIASTYSTRDLYQKLRTLNSAPFSAYLDLNYITQFDFQILSASPERFLSIRDRCLEARPIKGTINRGSNLVEEQKLIARLTNSEKDRAENIMIVDLLRNDLGKICQTGSIKVSQLCGIESFTNIHHMVSVITGELRLDKSIFDIILALFPGGSVTGAPKIRAMQLIEELEQTSRGIYCGSIGYFGFNGNVDFNIAIRTVIREREELKFYAGGAITLDSVAEAEYAETLLKAEKILEVIGGTDQL